MEQVAFVATEENEEEWGKERTTENRHKPGNSDDDCPCIHSYECQKRWDWKVVFHYIAEEAKGHKNRLPLCVL